MAFSSSVSRISFEISFEMSRNPIGLPEASRRGVMTTRAVKRLPFFRSRATVPSHLPSRSATSMFSRSLPDLHLPAHEEWKRIGFADDFFRLIAVKPPRALIPEQDFSFEILADDRIFGGRLKDVGDEGHRFRGIAHDGAVEHFGPTDLVHKSLLVGDIFGNQQKTHRLSATVAARG